MRLCISCKQEKDDGEFENRKTLCKSCQDLCCRCGEKLLLPRVNPFDRICLKCKSIRRSDFMKDKKNNYNKKSREARAEKSKLRELFGAPLICRVCKQEKPLADFGTSRCICLMCQVTCTVCGLEKTKEEMRKYRRICIECDRLRDKESRKRRREIDNELANKKATMDILEYIKENYSEYKEFVCNKEII